MNQSLREDLSRIVCDGNVAKLPTEKLNNYAELKNTLTKACGKYKRNTFEFPYPAQAIIDSLMSGETIDFKKEFQFFPTPPDVVERVCNDIIFDKPSMHILEPEAGHGAFVDHVLTLNKDVAKLIDLIELSELNSSILDEKYRGMSNIYIEQGDFLALDIDMRYDLILANPPFTKNQDIDHIKKMYTLLKPQGQLLTLSSCSWVQGSRKKQVEFREWLEEVEATYVKLDSNSFKSSGTMVDVMYINICK